MSRLGLFLLGLLTRVTSGSAAVGVLAGVMVILWLTLSPGWNGLLEAYGSPFYGFLTIVFGTVTILGVGSAAAWIFPSGRPDGTGAQPGQTRNRPGSCEDDTAGLPRPSLGETCAFDRNLRVDSSNNTRSTFRSKTTLELCLLTSARGGNMLSNPSTNRRPVGGCCPRIPWPSNPSTHCMVWS